MPIEAGETQANPASAAAPVPLVNADELARSIVSAVAQINTSQPPTVHQARVSQFEAKAKELLGSERIDKDVMPIMLDLISAMKTDLNEEQKEAAMKAAQEASTKNLHAELGRMVDRFAATTEDPELVRDMKVAIIKNAIDEYNADPILVRRYMTDGHLEWKRLEDSVVKRVSKLGGKKEESKPAGGPAMKNEAPSGAVETGKQVNKEMLDERQTEFFNSQVSFGMKNMGMDREKAEKRALERISQAETKQKSSKR